MIRPAAFEIRRRTFLKAQGPHSHILMTGGEGSEGFFGSDILAKRDFFGSRKRHRDFFGYCIFHQLKSTLT